MTGTKALSVVTIDLLDVECRDYRSMVRRRLTLAFVRVFGHRCKPIGRSLRPVIDQAVHLRMNFVVWVLLRNHVYGDQNVIDQLLLTLKNARIAAGQLESGR